MRRAPARLLLRCAERALDRPWTIQASTRIDTLLVALEGEADR